jgi:CO/xanthine dehydrogenase FAD-binding subunit
LQTLSDSHRLRSFAGGILAQAAELSGGSAMRQAATVGGLVVSAAEAAHGVEREGPPELLLALLALDALLVFRVRDGAGALQPLSEYLADSGSAASARLLREILLPSPAESTGGAIARVARTPRDQAIVAAVSLVEARAGRVERACLAVSAGGHIPQRLSAVEQAVQGQMLTHDLLDAVARIAAEAVQPQGDHRGSADYRRAMAGLMASRALDAALDGQARS